MRRRKKVLPVLLVAVAVLFSFPGAAMAESAESASDEQITAAVQRILEKRHTAEDLALVKSEPDVARHVPDPNGPSITVTQSSRTPRTPSGGSSAAAVEYCGTSEYGIGLNTVGGDVIYEWFHTILWCDDNTRITQIRERSYRITKIHPRTRPTGVTNSSPSPQPGGLSTRSYYQLGFTYCPLLLPCSNLLPYIGLELRAGGRFRVYAFGDAGL